MTLRSLRWRLVIAGTLLLMAVRYLVHALGRGLGWTPAGVGANPEPTVVATFAVSFLLSCCLSLILMDAEPKTSGRRAARAVLFLMIPAVIAVSGVVGGTVTPVRAIEGLFAVTLTAFALALLISVRRAD